MAEMAFGSGLRLAELLALRIKDVDLDGGTITVRGRKGDKDRVTCLPQSLITRLAPHLEKVRSQWQADRTRNAAAIALPDGLERKFPRAWIESPSLPNKAPAGSSHTAGLYCVDKLCPMSETACQARTSLVCQSTMGTSGARLA